MNFILPNPTNKIPSLRVRTAIAATGIVLLATPFFPAWVHAASPTPTTKARAKSAASSTPTPASVPVSTPVPDASAATDSVLSFTISPPRQELIGKPGDTLQTTLKVRNMTKDTQTFRSEVWDFIVAADGKTPQPVTENVSGRWSAAKWMSVTPNQVELPPNTSAELNVVIQIPQDALPGGHYAMVLHSPQVGAVGTSGAAAAVAPRSGTLFYITVAGDVKEELFIRSFIVPHMSEFGPIPLSYTLENQSDIHVAPVSTITIKNMLGVTQEVLKVDTKNIFPYTTRDFSAQWDTFWGLGRYTATLESAYGNSGKVVKGVASFWIIPYKIIVSLIVSLGALLAMGISIRRHILHRTNVQTQQLHTLEERIRELESQKSSDTTRRGDE